MDIVTNKALTKLKQKLNPFQRWFFTKLKTEDIVSVGENHILHKSGGVQFIVTKDANGHCHE